MAALCGHLTKLHLASRPILIDLQLKATPHGGVVGERAAFEPERRGQLQHESRHIPKWYVAISVGIELTPHRGESLGVGGRSELRSHMSDRGEVLKDDRHDEVKEHKLNGAPEEGVKKAGRGGRGGGEAGGGVRGGGEVGVRGNDRERA